MTGQERISKIYIAIPELEELYKSRVRHYTIMAHTINVYNQFETYFANKFSDYDIESFRLMLLLHDIGKYTAYINGNRKNQSSETLNVVAKHKQILNISDNDFQLYKALLSDDSLGLYIQNKISLDKAYNQITKQCSLSNLDIKLFFYLLSVYYQCDIASYTVDAGGLKYLEYLFEYIDGCKVYNDENNLLRLSTKYQERYNLLYDKIYGIEILNNSETSIESPLNIKIFKWQYIQYKSTSHCKHSQLRWGDGVKVLHWFSN